jgi:hypothetical protein
VKTRCVPYQSFRRRLAGGLGAGALILGLLFVLVGVVVGALFWVGTAISSGVHAAATATPSSPAYGVCDGRPPWSCPAVPNRTIESKFDRNIPPGSSVLTAEAEPIAGITGHRQMQVVMQLPSSAAADQWLSLLHGAAAPVADPAQVPELFSLGVTGITGGISGFTSVYEGQLDGQVYVWAYRRL